MKTYCFMEENYCTLSTEYNTLKEKENLIESINESIKIFDVTPEIYIKPFSHDTPGKGKVVVEFGSNNRMFGDFFEYLIADNNLECG